LQKHFYVESLREGVRDDYVEKKLRDIVTMRLMKIVSIAAKRLDGEIVRRMTPEEEALYRAVYRVVDEWLRAIGSGDGDGGATS
jgi:DNA replication initiation complex subunit (GINS family)